jgi:hypothetical protein
MRPIPQVTKAEVEAEKARLAAIDARPIKKVAEAKARKRKRAQVRGGGCVSKEQRDSCAEGGLGCVCVGGRGALGTRDGGVFFVLCSG